MTLTHCPVCHHALTSVAIDADLLQEVTVSWTCSEGHSDSITARVPAPLKPVSPEHPVVVPGGTYLRRHAPLVARL